MTPRTHLLLDGPWNFWIDPHATYTPDSLPAEPTTALTVPAPWQAHSDALRFYSDVGWYQRTFDLPADSHDRAVILHFGAVDYAAEVWLNGSWVGKHVGGYLPFEFDIAPFIQAGTNLITVRVDDPVAQFNEIPHGKQSWYGPLSGIWQSVWLEQRHKVYVAHLTLTPDLNTGTVAVGFTLATPPHRDMVATVRLVAPLGATVAEALIPLTAELSGYDTRLTVADPLPWSPDAPHLYTVEVQLQAAEEVLDQIHKSCGFRTIEARAGQIFLNGAPLYLRGALDQDYYPDTIATPPSMEFLEKQLQQAKELGLNCLRCHIKVPDPRYYEVADRLGMLIWTELPNWRLLTPHAMEAGRETLRGIVARDGHHPSIIIWTIINEDWGTNLMNDPNHRAWLKEMYHWLKALDPTRLVVDNSPCEGNFHVQSDLEDYHYYKHIPDQRLDWDTFVDAFASRTAPTYSPFGDAIRTGEEPLIVSEFGNWGLPDVELLLEEGQEPWWFETGGEFNEVVYPHGIQTRFARWGLERVFGSWRAFIEATQWQEFYALKYEIEAMRRRAEIAGYVITEFTDVHWECNGLLDMRRNRKVFHEAFASINADTVIVPQWTRTAYWAGEPLSIALAVAHAGTETLPATTLTCQVGDDNAVPLAVDPVAPGTVSRLGMMHFVAPESQEATTTTLALTLSDEHGRQVASNSQPLTIYPPWQGPSLATRIWSADSYWLHHLARLDYPLAATPAQADLLVAHQMTPELLEWAHRGKTVLLLVNHKDALGKQGLLGVLGIKVRGRTNTIWQGHWASTFAWLRRDGPFAALPGGPLLDSSFAALTPAYVLTGLGPWEFAGNVHAGLFVGWIHKLAALLVEQPYGKGKLIVTTLQFHPGMIGVDPTTTMLWDAVLEIAALRKDGENVSKQDHTVQERNARDLTERLF